MGKSWLTAHFPSLWLYALGGLFILVTILLPDGIVGLASTVRRRFAKQGETK